MSWNLIQSLFDGQGIVFWAAVSAVTLGLTMLSVSIVFQVRRMLGGKLAIFKRSTGAKASKTQDNLAVPKITVADDTYQASGFVPSAPGTETARHSADPLLNNLLERLKVSADRLEGIHASFENPGGRLRDLPDSDLKETIESVDYVYRTGRA